MIFNSSLGALHQSFYALLTTAVSFIPNILLALIILLVGWLIGVWVGWAISQVVQALRVDQALRSAGIDQIVHRSGYHLDSGRFLGSLVKWFVITGFLIAALTVLGLTQVNAFLQAVVLTHLPHVIIAVLIILVAAVIAEAVQKVVAGSARAAGARSAGLAGTTARYAIWVFAILAALDQLGVTPFVQTLFTGIVVAFSLAFGLAFGLGGQEAAARVIERMRQDIKHD